MNKKRICIVGPSLKMGGMERASSNVANVFESLNCDVLFLSIFKQDKFFTVNKGVKFVEPKGKTNTKKLNFFKTIFWIRSEVRKYRPDTVLVYNNFYSSIVLLALTGTTFPVFISDRASPIYNWPKHIKLFNLLIFRFLPPNGVIAQTSAAKNHQQKLFKKDIPIKVIPNILRKVKKFDIEKKDQVLAVGRLGDHLKGFDRLIDAFAQVKTDWKLVFAGGDENGEYLKDQAKELNIIDRIEFLGQVKNIDKIYSESKIFVIPSRSEGFPNALCEAMASGLACISYDFIAGPRDIIDDGTNGIIVEEGSIEKLAISIQFLVNNEKERNRLGVNALKIRQELNENIIGIKLLEFIIND